MDFGVTSYVPRSALNFPCNWFINGTLRSKSLFKRLHASPELEIGKAFLLPSVTEIYTWCDSGKSMAPRYEFTFSKSFRVDKGVKDAFEDEGFIVLRSLWSGAEVQRLLRFFETSPTIERNSYREIDGRGRTSGPSTLFIHYTLRTENLKFALRHRS